MKRLILIFSLIAASYVQAEVVIIRDEITPLYVWSDVTADARRVIVGPDSKLYIDNGLGFFDRIHRNMNVAFTACFKPQVTYASDGRALWMAPMETGTGGPNSALSSPMRKFSFYGQK